MIVYEKKSRCPESAFVKYDALHEIGKERHAFTAPKPLAFDNNRSTLQLEHISDLVPLSSVFPALDSAEAHRCATRIGIVLASIHLGWNEAEFRKRAPHPANEHGALSLPFCISTGSRRIVVHGDFGMGNIHCKRGDAHQLVILDPEPAPYLSFPLFASGPPCFDAGHFAGCLEGVFPPRFYPQYKWRGVPSYRRAFYDGYCSVAPLGVSFAEFEEFTAKLLMVFGGWLGGPGHSWRNQLLGSFLRMRARALLKGV